MKSNGFQEIPRMPTQGQRALSSACLKAFSTRWLRDPLLSALDGGPKTSACVPMKLQQPGVSGSALSPCDQHLSLCLCLNQVRSLAQVRFGSARFLGMLSRGAGVPFFVFQSYSVHRSLQALSYQNPPPPQYLRNQPGGAFTRSLSPTFENPKLNGHLFCGFLFWRFCSGNQKDTT